MGALPAFTVIPLLALLTAGALPPPQGFVNDFAGALDQAARQRLESRLDTYARETTNEIAIALVPSLNGGSIDTVANNLFEQWKIGKRGKDNGILIVAALQDRKVRIEVGYGLEGKVPDAQAGRIIREVLAPNFRAGRYAEGLEGAVGELIRLIGASTFAPPVPSRRRAPSYQWDLWAALAAFGFLLLVWQWGKRLLLPRCPRCGTVLVQRSSGRAAVLGGASSVLYVCPRCGYQEHAVASRTIGRIFGPIYAGRGWGSGGFFSSGGGGFSGFGGGSSGGGGASGSW